MLPATLCVRRPHQPVFQSPAVDLSYRAVLEIHALGVTNAVKIRALSATTYAVRKVLRNVLQTVAAVVAIGRFAGTIACHQMVIAAATRRPAPKDMPAAAPAV